MTPPVYAFEIEVKGSGWPPRIVNAHTAGKARYAYLLDVADSYPEMTFKHLRCRKVGIVRAVDPEGFARFLRLRGLTGWAVGDRCLATGLPGVIVGHNSSLNFDVLFDFGTVVGNVHPSEIAKETS